MIKERHRYRFPVSDKTLRSRADPEPEVSPFAISYCCRRCGKRPQLQIHARMPAQGAWRHAILRFVLIFNVRAAIVLTSNSESLTATQDSKVEIPAKIEPCKEALETQHSRWRFLANTQS